jgi:kynureninase
VGGEAMHGLGREGRRSRMTPDRKASDATSEVDTDVSIGVKARSWKPPTTSIRPYPGSGPVWSRDRRPLRLTELGSALVDRTACLAADRADPLAPFRSRFALPDGVLYLDGNSLGALQPAVATRLRQLIDDEWGRGLIRSWNDAGWAELPGRVAQRLAPIVGADADELAVTDSTSANLFKALAAARRLRPERRVLLTDDANFPTDLYVAHGLADLAGDLEVRVVPTAEVCDHLDDEVAVLTLTHVDYRSGRVHDPVATTTSAHAVGAVTVWDLSHSAGALDVDLHAWGADLAVGCTYKYLNGGPGSPAYLYVARRWHDDATSPVPGWFGHARPFDFDPDYIPAPGAARFLNGTAPVLSMAALETALEVWEQVDRADAAAKSSALTQTFIAAVDATCGDHVEVITPRDPTHRGAQVSLRHPHAYALTQALLDRGVIGDHRPPDLVRFGFSPLYVRHVDVWDAVAHLADLLATGAWDRPGFHARRMVP